METLSVLTPGKFSLENRRCGGKFHLYLKMNFEFFFSFKSHLPKVEVFSCILFVQPTNTTDSLHISTVASSMSLMSKIQL